MESSRNQWIDIVKGLGILLIVIGHIVDGPISNFLYVFHVPIFFFLSGYLFKAPENIANYIIKKFKQLLVPYFIFLFSITALLLIQQVFFKNNTNLFANYIQPALLGGKYLTGFFAVFWFITSLFFTQIIYVYLQRFNKNIVRIIVMLSLLFAYITSSFSFVFLTFWSLDTVFFTLPLYYLGHIYSTYKGKNNLLIAIVVIASLLPFYFLYSDLFYFDIKHLKYGVPIVSIVLSLALVVSMFYFSKTINKIHLLAKPLAYIGSISMTIMYMHQPIQITLKSVAKIHADWALIIATVATCLLCRYVLNIMHVCFNKLNTVNFLPSK